MVLVPGTMTPGTEQRQALDSHWPQFPGLHSQKLLTCIGRSYWTPLDKSPDLQASLDVKCRKPPSNDFAVLIQALEATSQAADDSLQPVLHALKNEAKPAHSGIRQYPEETGVLLSHLMKLACVQPATAESPDTPPSDN